MLMMKSIFYKKFYNFLRKRRDMLLKCAGTALNSKLLASHKDHFSELVV